MVQIAITADLLDDSAVITTGGQDEGIGGEDNTPVFASNDQISTTSPPATIGLSMKFLDIDQFFSYITTPLPTPVLETKPILVYKVETTT
jgi:hypothetical protein